MNNKITKRLLSIAKSLTSTEDVFAIQCFKNDKRMFTDKLTKSEAANYIKTAEYLISYLQSEYKIPKDK